MEKVAKMSGKRKIQKEDEQTVKLFECRLEDAGVVCGKQFSGEQNLRNHMKRYHKSVNNNCTWQGCTSKFKHV